MLQMFFNVIEINIVISILMILLLIFCKKIRKRYGALWMKVIWIILAVRLVIPFNISTQNGGIRLFTLPSDYSVVESSVDSNAYAKDNIVHTDENSNANSVNLNYVSGVDQNVTTEAITNNPSVDIDNNGSASVNEFDVIGDETEKSTAVTNNSEHGYYSIVDSKELIFAEVLTIIWIVGEGITLIVLHIRYLILVRSINKSLVPLDDEKVLTIWGRLSKRQSNNIQSSSNLKVYQSSAVNSPMLIGLFRTVLVVPDKILDWDEDVAEMILAHEMAHFCNRDLYVKALMNIACCMNWFNPFVYLLRKHMFYDMELRCDRKVLGSRAGDDREKYAKALLSLVGEKKRLSAFNVDFGNSKEGVKNRISFIFNSKKAKNGIIFAIATTILLLVGCFLVSCGNSDSVTLSDKLQDSAEQRQAEYLAQKNEEILLSENSGDSTIQTGECDFTVDIGQLGEVGDFYDFDKYIEFGEYELKIDEFYADITHDGIADRIETVVFCSDKDAAIDVAVNSTSLGSYVKIYRGLENNEYEAGPCFISRSFHTSHAGNGAICVVDYNGKDYLMLSNLYEMQGTADYNYTLFYIDDVSGIVTEDKYGVRFVTDEMMYPDSDGAMREDIEPLFDEHIRAYIENSTVLLAMDCDFDAMYSISETMVSGEAYFSKKLRYLSSGTAEAGTEKIFGGRTLTIAPERPQLTDGIEIVDVDECMSDFSLLITFSNNSGNAFVFGLDYALDVKIEGEWYEYAAYGSHYTSNVDYTLEQGKAKTMYYELSMYAHLPVGEYRLTTGEGISGEFIVDKPNSYELCAVGTYPERTADEIYRSMTEVCSEYESIFNYDNKYIFEKRGFHDIFYMYFTEDHRFGYFEGTASSYIGMGRWIIENGELIMTEDGGDRCNYFRIEDNVLIYEAEKSTGFIYAVVLDGDRFICDRSIWEETMKANSVQELLYYSF